MGGGGGGCHCFTITTDGGRESSRIKQIHNWGGGGGQWQVLDGTGCECDCDFWAGTPPGCVPAWLPLWPILQSTNLKNRSFDSVAKA